MQAVILAGGFGKRLAPLTSEVPKPLLPVGGRPILVRQIEWLRGFGVRDVVLAVGYLKHKIFEALGDGRRFGVRIFYSVEEEPLGTGGAIKNAELFITDDVFVVLNGDVLTNLDLNKLVEALGNADGAIALVPLRSPYGIVEFDAGGYVTHFREKPPPGGLLHKRRGVRPQEEGIVGVARPRQHRGDPLPPTRATAPPQGGCV